MKPYSIFSFSLYNHNRARDICDIFKQYGTHAYSYMICTSTGETIKHGLSNDNEYKNGTWGNRIYKQLLGAPGWDYRPYNGDTSAIEFSELMQEHYPALDKNDLSVTVWDFGSTDFLKKSKRTQDLLLEMVEQDFLTIYKEKHGKLPVGNIQAQRNRSHMKTYNNLIHELP